MNVVPPSAAAQTYGGWKNMCTHQAFLNTSEIIKSKAPAIQPILGDIVLLGTMSVNFSNIISKNRQLINGINHCQSHRVIVVNFVTLFAH